MSAAEQRRVLVLNHLEKGSVTVVEAAQLVGVSVRQMKRLRAGYRREGAGALAHGNRGKGPANAVEVGLARRVVELSTTTYQGFNQQHLTEMLAEREGLHLSRPTVHRLLKAAGVPAPRKRRPARAHHRRNRMTKEGCLLQVDGSRHDWLEGRGPYLTLVGAIDDATGLVDGATFREQEDAQGYFLALPQVVVTKGVPLALYSDRHGIFVTASKQEPSLEEQLSGRRQLTQMGRLLGELQVELILARSPQAKGRIERLWGTFQDRLVSELGLQGVTTLEGANRVLAQHLVRHNPQFAVLAQDPEPAWRPRAAQLEQLFCFKFHRVVALDHTVRFAGQLIDIPRPGRRSLARARVEVQQRFDGTLRVFHEGRCLATSQSQLLPGPLRLNSLTGPELPIPVPRTSQPRPRRTSPWRPAANHPWRRTRSQPG
ncbi:MAG TPA: ISNCY family transposase [Candidatus Dormibacteraeota bacterium]|nr:ISNCY family transposase [Candidatus Dormibacteraeota bacterium]